MPLSNPSIQTQPPAVNVTIPSVKANGYHLRTKNITAETTVEIAASNLNRQGFTIFNRGENAALIDVDTFLTNDTGYMFKLEPGAFYESLSVYTGSFYAVADAANGQPTILEIREFII
jgi:hypothetical protein